MDVIPATAGGKRHRVYNGYIYCSKYTKNNTEYLRCKVSNCKGKARIKNNVISTSGNHFHAPDPLQVEELRHKAHLRNEAATALVPLSSLYRRSLRMFPTTAPFIAYPSSVAMMRRARAHGVPPKPQSLQDVENILRTPEWAQWRRDIVGEGNFFRQFAEAIDNSGIVLLLSDSCIPDLLRHGVMLLVDGTFKTVPQVPDAYQLLTIDVVQQQEEPHPLVYPAAYFLLSNKTTDCYEHALHILQALIGLMSPSCVMCDFEVALRDAFKNVFVGIQILSCWFHFSQAVYRNAGKHGLIPVMNRNDNALRAVRRLMALPLLPARLIPEGYESIQTFIRDNNLMRSFNTFLGYMHRQWLTDVNPHEYSVYRHNTRTNNSAERFHLTLLESMKTHPTFWFWYDTLRELCCLHTAKMGQHDNGLRIREGQAASDREVQERISNLWDRLDHLPGTDPVTPAEFIAAAGYLVHLPKRRQVQQLLDDLLEWYTKKFYIWHYKP